MEMINLNELLSILSMVAILCGAISIGAVVLLLRRFAAVESAVDRLSGAGSAGPGASAQGFGGHGPLMR